MKIIFGKRDLVSVAAHLWRVRGSGSSGVFTVMWSMQAVTLPLRRVFGGWIHRRFEPREQDFTHDFSIIGSSSSFCAILVPAFGCVRWKLGKKLNIVIKAPLRSLRHSPFKLKKIKQTGIFHCFYVMTNHQKQ